MTDIDRDRVGVLGATSFVGSCLLQLFTEANWQVTAFSRCPPAQSQDGVKWRSVTSTKRGSAESAFRSGQDAIPFWVCVAPIWVLPDYFALLEAEGARRVIAVSSTSRFTKHDSPDPEEQALARRLAEMEARLQAWAESRGIEWVVLRPTLIYGGGKDKNITEIAHLIRRFGFFPLLGEAKGLRQPISAMDVAEACMAALRAPRAANRAYNISGGETLTYRELVGRVFSALGRRPCLLTVPLWIFRLAVKIMRCFPRYRKWSTAMGDRMNQDLVFDHSAATRDLGFRPAGFVLPANDFKNEVAS